MTVPARISLVTLGVEDVARSTAFYRALGWEAGIEMDGFAVFRTGGALLALYPIDELSRDAGDDVPAGRPRRTHLAINLGSPEEVDDAVARLPRGRRGAARGAGGGAVGRLHGDRVRPGRARLGDRPQPGLAARRGRSAAASVTSASMAA